MKSLAIGLMSGTSCDGLSIALCEFQNRQFNLLAYETYAYPKQISERLSRSADLRSFEISLLNVLLGRFFSAKLLTFLKKNRVKPIHVAVIGSHGHTIFHGPGDSPPHTFQIGEASFISQHTGIPIVSDFRTRDLAAGGEGAPLIPFFDQYFFGNAGVRAMQNIGGIANVTIVGKNIKPIAFDTGPGNCLIDWAMKKISKRRKQFDHSGDLASKGKMDMSAVQKMALHPYFKRRPPKSTGRELFNERFIPLPLLKKKPADLVSTLTFFTAFTIAESYHRFVPHRFNEAIVSGGGALNKTLMGHLKKLLFPVPVRSIEEFGVPAQAKEPIAFAFFALRALEGKTNRLPEKQIGRRHLILGKIIPGSQKSKIPPAELWSKLNE
ncbi:MAG: anhydro-N-acetylmuramic acid kinase [Candidatus Omnitrophica bacterium]|nr:anhydro-N-acetylmuramic acid kinase [Candidatus Omnitrophota bacterium]